MAIASTQAIDISLTANAALSSTDYRFVKSVTPLKADLAGAGEVALGIRQNSPASGDGVNVRIAGVAKLTIGSGGCSAGACLKPGSAGEGIATTTDKDFYGAIALEDGVDTQVISVVVTRGYVSAT